MIAEPQLAAAFKKLLHLGEEALMLRAAGGRRFGLELLQQFALPRDRFCGVSTATWMYMSPRCGAAQHGEALAAQAELLAGLRAGGILTLARVPSMTGTSISPPSAACVMRSGTRQKMLAPSRWKISCGRIETCT